MKRYNVSFPIAGALYFCGVEAESEEEAIEKCYELVEESEDPITEFDGDWEMFETISEGNVLHTLHSNVEVEEAEI